MRILRLDAEPDQPNSPEPQTTDRLLSAPEEVSAARSRSNSHRKRQFDQDWLQVLRRKEEIKDLNTVLLDENIHISAEIEALREEKITAKLRDEPNEISAEEAQQVHVLSAQIKEMQQQFKLALEKFKIQALSLQEERGRSRALEEQLGQLKAAAGELATIKEQLPKTLEAIKAQRERIIQQQTQISVLGLGTEASFQLVLLLFFVFSEP